MGISMKNKPDYANWITNKFLFALGGGAVVAALLFTATFWLADGYAVLSARIVLAAAAMLGLVLFIYMCIARRMLAYDGGGIQGKILDNVLDNLEWDGKGTFLDIGCGSGAMAIKAARRFPEARVVGVDYWGFVWDYAKGQCEENARIERVAERVTFLQGDAAKLDFAEGTFDAVVSNFVFHEVRSQPDKVALIREALRVLKPGGVFSIEDIFFAKGLYGDFEKTVRELSGEVAAIVFVDTRKNDFVPAFLRTPLMAGTMGLIKGKK